MASAVQIANLALMTLGDDEGLIELSTDSRAGRAILAVFDVMRDALLREHPWNFAMTRARLPALADAPVFGFAFAYELPADWLRFWDEAAYQPHAIEGRQILTNRAPPLDIRYVRRVTDPGLFDALFVDALAARIAAKIAKRLTGSTETRAEARDEAAALLSAAKKVDGQENPPEDLLEDDWVIAREADL